MERSTRTAFAYNLNLKADERDVYQLFSKVSEGPSGVSPSPRLAARKPRMAAALARLPPGGTLSWECLCHGPSGPIIYRDEQTNPHRLNLGCACTPYTRAPKPWRLVLPTLSLCWLPCTVLEPDTSPPCIPTLSRYVPRQTGKVVDIKLITDKTTKRSKGFAYIE